MITEMFVSRFVYMHVCLCAHVCMYAYVYMQMYVCICTFSSICIYIKRSNSLHVGLYNASSLCYKGRTYISI